MVTIRWRLHMAGSAQEFSVVDGILSTVATGLPVMKVEVHRYATALTPCSTFCLMHRLRGQATLGFDDIGHTS